MDSLKTLMDKRQYDLVLRITENATDSNSLFYRVSALLVTGKSEESLACIKKNRAEMQKNLPLLIKMHIELLCILQKFDEAYSEMEYYENLPYESQEVEESLKKYRKYIREAEKDAVCSKDLSDADIVSRLCSKKASVVLDGLQAIRNKELMNYMPLVRRIMVNFPMQSIRSFALMLLVEKKFNGNVDFLHVDKQIQLNPSLLEPPFSSEKFVNFVKLVNSDFKNPVLSQNALNIYSTYLIFTYPDECLVDEKVMLCALYKVAGEFLKSDDADNVAEKCQENGVNPDEVEKVACDLRNSIEIL